MLPARGAAASEAGARAAMRGGGMSEPIDVDPARFFEFVGRRGLVVVFLPFHRAHPFNRALGRHLRNADGSAIPIGRVNLVELVLATPQAVVFLQRGLRARGVSRMFDVLPGYYLFDDGELLAWEPGFPTTADLDVLVGASLLGAIAYAFTRDLAFITKALGFGVHEAVAKRMAARFREASEAPRQAPRAAPPPSAADELLNAYRLLGVDPSASDREVNAAWRRRQAELHPDRVAGDPQEFERRTRVSAALNHARELVRAHRARMAARAAGPAPAS
jgi:DnaJ-domain-containing protein 1